MCNQPKWWYNMALTNKLWNRGIVVRRLVTDKKMQGAALPWPTQVVRAAGPEAHTSAMPLEEPLSVEVNGQRVAVLMRLPGSEKELGAGFCISEGIIASFDAVLTVHHCGRGLPDPIGSSQEQAESRNRVQIRARPEAVHFDAQSDVVRLIRTGCGAVEVTDMVDNLPRLNSDLCVPAEMLLGLNAAMRQAQDLYKVSGGVHAAAAGYLSSGPYFGSHRARQSRHGHQSGAGGHTHHYLHLGSHGVGGTDSRGPESHAHRLSAQPANERLYTLLARRELSSGH
jgi:hypothetical protein